MPSRVVRHVVSTAVTAAVAASLVGIGVGSAAAVEAPQPPCTNVHPASRTSADVRAAIGTLSSCLAGLRQAADSAGRTAEVADEHYLKTEAAAKAAADRYTKAQAAADAATGRALKSRARASLVAADLARSGGADQAANLILDGGGATRVLYRVSRMSQLSTQSAQIFGQARADDRTAHLLEARASDDADAAQRSAATAKAAFEQAKQQAASARAVVRNQLAREHALQAELAALQPPRPVVHHTAAPAASASSAPAPSASSSAAPAPTPVRHATLAISTGVVANASVAATVLAFARAHIGDPYAFAGSGPNAWDCSGLTMASFAAAGIGIGGHSATAQYDLAASEGKLVPYSSRQPGDLIFYTDGGGDMYHVAIYAGGGAMIEAPYAGVPVRETPVRSYQLVGQVARFTG